MKSRFTRFAAPLTGVALACAMALSSCSTTPEPTNSGSATPATTSATTSTTPDTKTAEKVLLVVSFGTSYDNNRDLSIGGVENALASAYPDYEVRRAFTSQIIIDKLASRGTVIDNVDQAMDKIVAEGIKEIVIQPTTIMAGFEYTDLVTETTAYKSNFDSFSIGAPLLTTDADFTAVAKAITDRTAQYAGDDTAVIFMGHGTGAPSNAVYGKLGGVLASEGYKNYFVGTVEGTPTMDDMIQAATTAQVKKVVLQPLMVVAGDHANNDMAGDDADSWKSQFTAAGFEVQTLIEGLGQNPAIQQIYVQHAKEAMSNATSGASSSDSADSSPAPKPDAAEVAGEQIQDGTYPITVTTTSSMFKVVDAQLSVDGERMLATVTLSGSGYGRLLLGTADQATQATTGFIEFTSDDQGRHVYEVPVSRLNKPMAIAAESGKTPGKWYDQTVTFLSDQIPASAITSD